MTEQKTGFPFSESCSAWHGIFHAAMQTLAAEERLSAMVEIVRTNDLVLVGFLQSLLEDANIPVLVADTHVSAIEGMIGAFPRRLLVPEDNVEEARQLIRDAGLEAELRHG